ncbi:MAG: lysylphosphatidylglycerol synthase domain-containing protein, partial [Thermoanaerobaculia bacterium]
AASALLDGFGLVKKLSAPQWIAVVSGSLVMWFVINLQIACVVNAFGIDLPLSATYVLTFAAVLGLAVPTPAGIGGYHAAVAGALVRFGVSGDAALGAATVSHAVSFVPISVIGLGMLVLRSLGTRAQEPL